MKTISIIILMMISSASIWAQEYFFNSLHRTRTGIEFGYSKINGGMENITNIPIDSLSCKKCHSTTGVLQNGTPIKPETYIPFCLDCHNFKVSFDVSEQACLTCHLKQKYEREKFPGMDVHANAGLTCISCHPQEEFHGELDIAYSSLKVPGAIKVKCTNCHVKLSSNPSHNHHLQKVDCAACHAVSVFSCAGCHFESYTTTAKMRYINDFSNYRLLIKKDGIVKLGEIITQSYKNKTNYVISSTHSHIIQKRATACSDCHRAMGQINVAIQEYNNTGFITLAKWNETTRKVDILNAVIPVPVDWQNALKVDHVTYTGDSSLFPSDPDLWQYLKSETDNAHLYFAEPLDESTMSKLGMTRFPSDVKKEEIIPTGFILNQNYPNPFNPTTKISWQSPVGSWQTLKVYDILGNEIATLVDKYKSAGRYEVEFNAENVPSGIYFYQLIAGDFIQTKKMLLIR